MPNLIFLGDYHFMSLFGGTIMKVIELSPDILKGLQEHLADIEDRQSQIIEDFIIKNSDEHREYTAEFKNYLFCLRELVDKSKEVAGKDNAMPIVTIGTLVTVMNVGNQREFSFHIVGPNYNRKNSRDVSCLSPVGRALMLKKVGDEVLVNAPGGTFKYQIKSIDYIGE
jgi:transcription elongation factor GreA